MKKDGIQEVDINVSKQIISVALEKINQTAQDELKLQTINKPVGMLHSLYYKI